MSKPKLTYFDAPTSRGEECRLALCLAGVEFEDVRIQRTAWPELKPKTPFGGLPTFEVEGHPVLGQSNAILAFIGRRWGLHPKDDFEAARHESVMAHVEDLRAAIGPSLSVKDETEKKRAREEFAATYLPAWAERAERQIGDGPFFAGAAPHVVDAKLYVIVRWLTGGKLDHVPTSVIAGYSKLVRVHDAVRDHARVKAWYARA
jgi:glutathione S-transferase